MIFTHLFIVHMLISVSFFFLLVSGICCDPWTLMFTFFSDDNKPIHNDINRKPSFQTLSQSARSPPMCYDLCTCMDRFRFIQKPAQAMSGTMYCINTTKTLSHLLTVPSPIDEQLGILHYENTPIQIYRKFHLKTENFQTKTL